MEDNNLFYRYYDSLYRAKDYASEIETVLSVLGTNRKPQRVLEIGCGTGNHTIELAKRVSEVVAIDIDNAMCERCLNKLKDREIKNVNVACALVEQLSLKEIDLAVALFNVVTYVDTFASLRTFFRGVRECLRIDGYFVFDCWNGVAALRDPPSDKKSECDVPEGTLHCKITSRNNLLEQITDLDFKFQLSNSQGEIEVEDTFSFRQRLWTPSELTDALESAGFRVDQVCKLFEPWLKPDADDWKIMFFCQAT